MLSKNMYITLSCFPKNVAKTIKYEILVRECKLSEEEIAECLGETLFPAWNYVRCSNGFKNGSELSLTESGLAEVEAYEQMSAEHEIVKQSLSVARIAMWVSIISAGVSLVSLVKMFM